MSSGRGCLHLCAVQMARAVRRTARLPGSSEHILNTSRTVQYSLCNLLRMLHLMLPLKFIWRFGICWSCTVSVSWNDNISKHTCCACIGTGLIELAWLSSSRHQQVQYILRTDCPQALTLSPRDQACPVHSGVIVPFTVALLTVSTVLEFTCFAADDDHH